MRRDLICIVCPRGCAMEVSEKNGEFTVSGNACQRGADYAYNEIHNPTRMVTALVRVTNRKDTMLSVKTACPISKENIFLLMDMLSAVTVEAPVKIGEVILPDVFGTDVIATKNIE